MSVVFLRMIALVFLAVSLTNGCDTGWFGLQCKYQCRCFYDKYCSLADQCFSGGNRRCQRGSFGPACQYDDLTQSDSMIGGRKLHILTDNDETTCLNQALTRVIMSWTHSFLFTWLRVHFSKPSHVDLLSVTFKTDNSTELFCHHRSSSVVSETAVDIYCRLPMLVTQVILTGISAGSLCSVYVSGGRNVALREQTSQSSTFFYPLWLPDIDPVASLAVDGNTNRTYERGDCTHTAFGDRKPTWHLTFLHPVIVTRYVIYNRDANTERAMGFILTSRGRDGDIVFTYQDTTATFQPVYTITPTNQSSVSSLTIEATSVDSTYQEKFLSLCEVQVYGDTDCNPGWFGVDCRQKCACPSCLVSTGGCPIEKCENTVYGQDCSLRCPEFCDIKDILYEVCNRNTGACTQGCQEGYRGPMCNNTCDDGLYGPDCRHSCPQLCQVNSHSDPICDRRNGTCLQGCQAGYKGPVCSEFCDYGTYGKDCSSSCSQFCGKGDIGEAVCNHINGTCLHGCQTGYQGAICDELCSNGKYGLQCSLPCPASCAVYSTLEAVCHHIHGTCLQGCQAGFTGPACNDKCEFGKYGQNCSTACPDFCAVQDASQPACGHVDGACLHGCQIGYRGPMCTDSCASGTYGQACNSSCPHFCKVADQSVPACDHIDGRCLQGCQAGYTGEHCEKQCEFKKYGEDCNKTCPILCEENDSSQAVCNHIHGACLQGCQAGYRGPVCSELCASGTYGQGCNSSCPQFCKWIDQNAPACDHIDGRCLQGCQDGYAGIHCDTPCASGTYGQACTSSCSHFCKVTDQSVPACDHTDGRCLQGCQAGYTGEHCEKSCASGTYGQACNSSCSNFCKVTDQSVPACDHTDGRCLQGCQAGYTGEQCEKSCASGTYGQACNSSCPHFCKVTDQSVPACDHIDGRCLQGCQAGYTGEHCDKPCTSGAYGEGCSLSCPHACKVTDQNVPACDPIDGRCLQGCQVGYIGEHCDKHCTRDKYGDGCNTSCPQFCNRIDQNVSACDHIDGRCLQGCQAGYTDTHCDKHCPSDTYGQGCNFSCPQLCTRDHQSVPFCDHIDGQCLQGCQVGYIGIHCENHCTRDKYGDGCYASCPQFCNRIDQNVSACDHIDGRCLQGCQAGYTDTHCDKHCLSDTYGQDCNFSCPQLCNRIGQNVTICDHNDGTCLEGCQVGYMGKHCENPCTDGTFGQNCNSVCPKFCKLADSGVPACEHIDGHCLQGCQAGYMGRHCESQCVFGKYGSICNKNCPDSCFRNDSSRPLCDVNGHCLQGCETGYSGPTCGYPCPSGTYGQNCLNRCPQFCIQDDQYGPACDNFDGICRQGCQAGYVGSHCENKQPTAARVALSHGRSSECPTGWFGAHCKYKCHCFHDYSCSEVEPCSVNGKIECQPGWFGSACQYVDLAQGDTVGEHKLTLDTVIDGDDSTCLTHGITEVVLTWSQPYLLSWLRVYVNEPITETILQNLLQLFEITFKKDANSSSMPCHNHQAILYDRHVIDMKCNLAGPVTQLVLSGSGLKVLCSLYVSGGRNVALKQITSQTSTWSSSSLYSRFVPESAVAVDGNTNTSYQGESCTLTNEGDIKPTWHLSFVQPMTVSRYVIYNRNEHSERLQGFILTAYDINGQPVFVYKDRNSVPKLVYTVVPEAPSTVSSLSIEATNKVNLDSMSSSRTRSKFLTLCEVEVYGDTDDASEATVSNHRNSESKSSNIHEFHHDNIAHWVWT